MPSSPDGPKDGRISPVVANPHNPHKKHRSKAGLWLDSWWVLDPRTAKFITWWDLLMTFALFYVALVTPVEVAFIDAPEPAEKWGDSIFLINRMLDCLFITDMVLQFRLGFKSETAEGTQWIMSSHAIAMNYLKSFWFSLDFFSVLTVRCGRGRPSPRSRAAPPSASAHAPPVARPSSTSPRASHQSVFDLVDIGGANSLVSLKVLRTLRLLKLVKARPPLPLGRPGRTVHPQMGGDAWVGCNSLAPVRWVGAAGAGLSRLQTARDAHVD